jgi:uncharacterized protein (TIGR00369 family)
MEATGTGAVGVAPIETLRSMSGIDFLRAIQAGRLPRPPIGAFFGFDLAEIEDRRVVFASTPGHQHYNPIGTVHGGYAATLLDSCMSCAVQTTVPAGSGYTTLEFKVSFIRPITIETGPVRAEGIVLAAGRRTGTAEGRITDANGRLLAHGTTTCLIFSL